MKIWGNLIVVGCLVAFVLTSPWPFYNGKDAAKRTACLSNVKQQVLGIQMYAEDRDGRLPYGNRWMDATRPYLSHDWGVDGARRAERCPELTPGTFGYAFNAATSGRRLPEFGEKTPLVYDSTTLSRNASDRVASLPRPGRHQGKDSVAYTDGHARAMIVR